jgi:hypothetical protein
VEISIYCDLEWRQPQKLEKDNHIPLKWKS